MWNEAYDIDSASWMKISPLEHDKTLHVSLSSALTTDTWHSPSSVCLCLSVNCHSTQIVPILPLVFGALGKFERNSSARALPACPYCLVSQVK